MHSDQALPVFVHFFDIIISSVIKIHGFTDIYKLGLTLCYDIVDRI